MFIQLAVILGTLKLIIEPFKMHDAQVEKLLSQGNYQYFTILFHHFIWKYPELSN